MLADAAGGAPQVILIATGAELHLCIDAYERLVAEGVRARVVSLPSWECSRTGRKPIAKVLPPAVTARVAVEAAAARLGPLRRAGRDDHRHATASGPRRPRRSPEAIRLHRRERSMKPPRRIVKQDRPRR